MSVSRLFYLHNEFIIKNKSIDWLLDQHNQFRSRPLKDKKIISSQELLKHILMLIKIWLRWICAKETFAIPHRFEQVIPCLLQLHLAVLHPEVHLHLIIANTLTGPAGRSVMIGCNLPAECVCVLVLFAKHHRKWTHGVIGFVFLCYLPNTIESEPRG